MLSIGAYTESFLWNDGVHDEIELKIKSLLGDKEYKKRKEGGKTNAYTDYRKRFIALASSVNIYVCYTHFN